MATKQTLLELIEPVVEDLGYELIELEYRTSDRGLLRLFIDSADGIGLDDCENVSREVSALLDVKDPITGQYVLEVSSPGENRYLRKPQHFADFAGHRIKVELKTLLAGRRRCTGELLGIEQDEVVVETDDETLKLKLDVISSARLAPLSKPQKRVKRA